MYPRLAAQIRKELPALIDQYDAQLRNVPGYASMPEPARRDLERQVLQITADCLEAGDDSALIQYIHERAEQVLARGFQPEWFQQAVTLAEEVITPLIKKVDEGNFVWRAMNRAQTATWQIVARERQRIELTLRESEARYQTIFDSTPIMFWLKDAHNRTLRINRAAAALEGVNPADVEGKSAYDLYPHEQAEAFYQDDLAVINSGQPKLGIVEQHTSVGTGKLMWLETGKTPVHNDQGEATGVLAFAVDITERKQAEEILRQSAESQQRAARYLRATIEAADELARTSDLDTLYRRAVESAREKLGVERCGLYLIDESGRYMFGTYGTDDQRRTTDERDAQRETGEFERILTAHVEELWVVRETPHIFVENGVAHTLGAGWVAGTVLRGAAGPIGILFNDKALSGESVDETQQEALAVYCSAVASIIERKRAEDERHAAFEKERIASERLRAIVTATDELIRTTDLDVLYQRAVELAREKLGVERCALYVLDEAREWVLGTYGTDAQGQTTDEHSNKEAASHHQIISVANEQQWVTFQADLKYWEGDQDQVVGTGWNVATAIRSAVGPIGILFNDAAISHKPYDEGLQQTLALYCSMLANIIENKRLELQIRQSLQLRGNQVQTSIEVAQEIAAASESEELFHRVVTLIKERFNYYHAQIFRFDSTQNAVVLVTSYGEVGRMMLAAGHQLPMGRGVVGNAAATGESILATDVRLDEDWRPNPNLPETRGELAIPIKLRNRVLGILDVQSAQVNTLTDDDRLLLEGLCGQIAIAMESTRLLEELRSNEAELSQALQIAKLAYWEYDVEKDLFHFNDQFYSLFHTTVEQQGSYQLSSAQYAGKFVYPDDLPVVGSEIEKALNSTDRHYGRDLVHRIQYADGGIGYISVKINIDRDEQGHILRYYGANQDITASKLAEVELEKFKLGLERSTAAVFITDPQGVISYVNPAFEKIYGYSPEEAVGHTPRLIKSGLIPQEQYKRFWETLLAGQPVAGEIVNQAKDGRLISIEGSNSAILDEQGAIVGFLALHNDITDRKRAEQDLLRFRQGLEQASDAIFTTDVEGHITYVNPAFEHIYGYTREETLGQTPRILKSGQISPEYYQNFWQTLLARQSISGEKPNKTKDGRVIIVEDSNSPILDEAGNLLGFLSTHRDITARKQTELDLRKFKLGLEHSNSAVFITDPQGVISYVNPAFEKIYGYTPKEALGQTPRLIKSGVVPQEQYRSFWSTLLGKQTVAGEIINKTKDGRLIQIDGSNNPILNEAGEIVGFLGVHTDITERKRTEEELARSAQLLNTIINTSRDLIYIKNTKSEFVVASQALARLMGARNAEELIGKSDFDFFSYELANKYFTDEQKIIQSGESLIDVEEPSAYPDGTQIWLLTTKIPYRAADGTLLGLLGIGRDITERKRAEQQMEETLRETERLYAAVSAEGWKTFRQSGQLPQGYRFDRVLLQPAEQIWEPEMAQAVSEEKTVATHSEERSVAVTPLAVRGAIIGALGVYDNPDQPLQAEDLALVEAASEQVALALESARLFEQTQHDAERERTISAISERIYSTTDVKQLMQITAEELRRVTGSARAVVRLNLGSGDTPEKLAHPNGGSETSNGGTIQ